MLTYPSNCLSSQPTLHQSIHQQKHPPNPPFLTVLISSILLVFPQLLFTLWCKSKWLTCFSLLINVTCRVQKSYQKIFSKILWLFNKLKTVLHTTTQLADNTNTQSIHKLSQDLRVFWQTALDISLVHQDQTSCTSCQTSSCKIGEKFKGMVTSTNKHDLEPTC